MTAMNGSPGFRACTAQSYKESLDEDVAKGVFYPIPPASLPG
jgi:hypothetical protein